MITKARIKVGIKLLATLLLMAVLSVVSFVTAKVALTRFHTPVIETRVNNVIFMIGDGMGANHILAGSLYKGAELSMVDRINCGYVNTWSLTGLTDSAAAATAMANGRKTYNGAIGEFVVDFPNITQFAHSLGKRTGVVATKNITDATPAAFTAHNFIRSNEQQIALEQIEAEYIDLLVGCGKQYFDPYADRINTDNRGYVTTPEALVTVDKQRVYGMFDEEFSLAEVTAFALDRLSCDNGFFLMVEGSKIDSYSHENDFDKMIHELMEFDRAVAVAKDYVLNNPDTILVITADHETGGLQVPAGATFDSLGDHSFTTGDHTNQDVRYFAFGKGADEIPRQLDNTYWYSIFKQMLS